MSQLQLLHDLQQYDTEIHDKKQRLGEVLRAQKETPAMIAARQQVAALTGKLQTLRAAHKDLALELGTVVDKAKRSEERLYSGNVKNPKELTDLQHEIESLGRRRDTLETEVLEALMAAEAQEADLQTAQAELDSLTAEWQGSLGALQAEQQTLAMRLVQLGPLREQKAARVSAGMLRTYDRLIQQKGGTAVALLKGSKCLSCQVTVPADRIRDAEKGTVVYCDSCGRILFAS
jgi:predicted  nucleic acid-binding Zn-ribbon protein